MHSFYTYAHARKTDGRIFYIGKGKGKRAYSESNRNRYWHNVVNKHGYEVQILCDWPTEEEAFDHEKLLISCFRDMGYELVNLTDGGEGPSGVQRSEETRARLSKAGKSYFADPEARAKKSEASKGRSHSPETRAKLSETSKGRSHTMEARARISQARRGKSLNPETRAKIGEANRGRTPTPETRAKLSEARKGRSPSLETRAKLSEANKGKSPSPETLARLSKATRGRIWVNNGIESKRVKPDTPVPEGFVLGRLPRKKV